MKKRNYIIFLLTILVLFTNNTFSIFAKENKSIEDIKLLKILDTANNKKNVFNNVKVKNYRLNADYDKLNCAQFNDFSYIQKEVDELSNQIYLYKYFDVATSQGVTLKVEWNDPVLGQETTFHVSATGGSGNYKFRMEAPSYTDPDVLSYESVADPSRGEWLNYTEECSSHDYTFTMMASGTYNFRFYVMDNTANMNYLRTNTFIQVSSPNYPSVNSIVQSAVAQCNAETDGSDYAKALWLHDWLLNQLDYDKSLKWSSAESALTRGLGTCQSYESAYSKLLTAAGIENAETRDTYDGHTWNAFKIDGEWYQVDCTWDDSNDDWYNFDERRLYFGLTDELMSIAHPGHAKIYTEAGYVTRSTSLANNYFVKSGEAAQWVASYKDRIQENLNAGKTQFSITADNAAYPPSIYGIQNGIIAYVMNQMDWKIDNNDVKLNVSIDNKKFLFTVIYYNKNDASKLDKLADKYKNIITDGNYVLSSSIKNSYVMDVRDGSKSEGANIELKNRNSNLSQVWKVSHDEKGYVTFTNSKTGKVLSIDNATNDSNIFQKEKTNNYTEKWIVKEDGTIVSALDEKYVIDLRWAEVKDGSNIQLYESNGSMAQKWQFHDASKLDKLADKYKNIVTDGNYVLSSSIKNSYVMDVRDGSKSEGANIELKNRNSNLSQVWKVSHDEKGYVTFTNSKTGKVLSIDNATNDSNIFQKEKTNNYTEKWIVKEDGTIVSALDEKYVIDLRWAEVKDGSNIQLYESNGSMAQKWMFRLE